MIAVFKKDLSAYFTSSMAYIMIAIFVFLAGALFFVRILSFEESSAYASMYAMQSGGGYTINNAVLEPSIMNVAFLLLLILPLFTMRVFSEEKRHGTLELLFTYPVTEWQLVIGKLFSCLCVIGLGLLITLLFNLCISGAGGFDWSYLIAGYFGLVLLSAASISVGLWVSSFTDKQLIAGIVTFMILLAFWLAGIPAYFSSGFWADVFNTLSFDTGLQNFSKGVLDLKNILYFVCFSLFFLYLTYYNLLARKWRG